ncbi:MAG: cupin domain-containing protein [Armatimonadetes bacterium]|nr:cupin domain-containing protein [Armatimonadota bacterium]
MNADWTQNFELEGEERARALEEAAAVIAGWGLTMPPCRPLPLHFGLGDFQNIGETEYWIVNEPDYRYCGKFLFLFEGQRCPRHHHITKDETFYIVKGSVDMEAGEKRLLMREGETLQVSPGTGHTFAASGGPALVLEVSLPSVPGDNIFEDGRIGNRGVL